jgi:hypothetical protein
MVSEIRPSWSQIDQRGRKSDQRWSKVQDLKFLVQNPKLFPTNTFKSVLVGNPFETNFYSKDKVTQNAAKFELFRA